jgi:hypothetical protein
MGRSATTTGGAHADADCTTSTAVQKASFASLEPFSRRPRGARVTSQTLARPYSRFAPREILSGARHIPIVSSVEHRH